ncbi:MAG: TraR/DksA family transcriptional regulator [Planctomycetota bacterium]|jgi:RNA polymerase-binding transcription factor DksA|nr:TraR/DksA family transcriptional regulator [Planctomycetota bacterium]MDP6762417.1 TraR/DksA family transcriptional regulator [Planctomycetota bacterium]MDP6989553.1 TraR/DksA family transcriptional regulator [Planctomycetota bacterium]
MPGRKPTAEDLTTFKSQLQAMLGLISGDISHLRDDLASGGGEHQGDEGERYFQGFNLELLQHDESTVQELLDALDRIEEGTYGRCAACGVWIRKDRLRAVPHARNCIECQRGAEAG